MALVYANYRQIGGPNGLLARRRPFKGNTMKAYYAPNGNYIVVSYHAHIGIVYLCGRVWLNQHYYSRTTSRHQNLCRAWL